MARRPLILSLPCALGLVSLLLTHVSSARGDQVTLTPSKDNSIFEEDGLSDGKGTGIFAGQTARTQSLRRALIAFDVAGTIPAGATITSVQLQLRVTMTASNTQRQMSLHRLLADWGEGDSNSNVRGGGMGAPAAPGDATWSDRFFDTVAWATPGGDFNPTASATGSAGNINTTTTFASTTALVADVQGWLANPQSNFGWILRGVETSTGTAKRFASREVTQAAQRPQLIVAFEMSADTPTATPTATLAPPTFTPTVTRTATPTRPTSTPTATITPGGPCVGDCSGMDRVRINDLIIGVNIALDVTPVSACPAFDPDGSGTVTVADLVTAVNNALNGCPL